MAKWESCEHFFGPEHGLRYPNLRRYGTLRICIRCSARRYENLETGVVRIDPPVPRGGKAARKASGVHPIRNGDSNSDNAIALRRQKRDREVG